MALRHAALIAAPAHATVNLSETYALLCASFGPGPWMQGGFEVWLKNAIYPVPEVRAGKSSKVKVDVAGLAYEPPDAAGFWTGPFDLKG